MSFLSVIKRPGMMSVLLFAAVLGVCWGFPQVWYSHSDSGQRKVWFRSKTEVKEWRYQEVPVGKAAEAILVADELVNGEFENAQGEVVRVYSAKRIDEKNNELGLFVHTPDRCWTEVGWKIDPQTPDLVEMKIHSVQVTMERRVFKNTAGGSELVYFAGLVGGQALPYRLNHNLTVGMRYKFKSDRPRGGAELRATDSSIWKHLWESFSSRRELLGPKQLIRISTPFISQTEIAAKDQLLQSFLEKWLEEEAFGGGREQVRR